MEFRLPLRFAVEADALYQRVGYSFASFEVNGGFTSTFSLRERDNLWEFPLLGKYYFRPRTAVWQPFVAAGVAFRTGSLHSAFTSITNGTASVFHADSRLDVETGAAVAAGIKFKTGPVALLPQARYTYWGNDTRGLAKNEAKLLLGLSF